MKQVSKNGLGSRTIYNLESLFATEGVQTA